MKRHILHRFLVNYSSSFHSLKPERTHVIHFWTHISRQVAKAKSKSPPQPLPLGCNISRNLDIYLSLVSSSRKPRQKGYIVFGVCKLLGRGSVPGTGDVPGTADLYRCQSIGIPVGRLGSNYARMCVSKSEGHGSFFSFKGVK